MGRYSHLDLPTDSELAASRRSDPPNAGYATRREREASDWLNETARQFERDRKTLLLIVVGGRELWRQQARKTMRGMLLSRHLDEVLDQLYAHFVEMAGPDPMRKEHTIVLVEHAHQSDSLDCSA